MPNISATSFHKFQALPDELQTQIVEQVATFGSSASRETFNEPRAHAQHTLQALRQVSKRTKSLIDYGPSTLRVSTAALQRFPGLNSRFEAAGRDFEGGMSAQEAIQQHGVKNPIMINILLSRGANRDFDSGLSAQVAVANNGLKSQPHIDDVLERGARRDFNEGQGVPVQEAISMNGLTNESHINALRLRAAILAIEGGMSNEDAVTHAGVTNPQHLGILVGEQ